MVVVEVVVGVVYGVALVMVFVPPPLFVCLIQNVSVALEGPLESTWWECLVCSDDPKNEAMYRCVHVIFYLSEHLNKIFCNFQFL